MLNCQEITRLVSEAQDRPLSLGEKLSLRTHLLMCSGCRNYEKNIASLRIASRAFTQGVHEQKKKAGMDDEK
ncbi:MAG: zf-HC2 domain-containing protein [Pseudomonadota bacterium]